MATLLRERQLDVEALLRGFNDIKVDSSTIEQHRLDLKGKERSSLFPWRGQFSPEFVALLLSVHAGKNTVVLDPFVGSGTTLFEAARYNLTSYGVEINPAAIYFANAATFSKLTRDERKSLFAKADKIIESCFVGLLPATLFGPAISKPGVDNPLTAARKIFLEAKVDKNIHTLFGISLMLAMGDGDKLDSKKFFDIYQRNKKIITDLTVSSQECSVFAADARQIPLERASVDLIITSPPYINVFNYHQNYRKALELIGWDALHVAKSEMGANRKHRSNRLLTVIQYSIDMAQTLREMHRVLRKTGKAIFVVGRESKVRGISFPNGKILALLAKGSGAFRITGRQERCFTNRFGASIYEDIITLEPLKVSPVQWDEVGRDVARWALQNALNGVELPLKQDIIDTIKMVPEIQASPIFYAK